MSEHAKTEDWLFIQPVSRKVPYDVTSDGIVVMAAQTYAANRDPIPNFFDSIDRDAGNVGRDFAGEEIDDRQ